MQTIFTFLQSLLSTPEIFVPTLWVSFGCTLAWYLLSAKRYQEVTPQEVNLLWKTHKQFSGCNANKFEQIRAGMKLVGYHCQCGHKHRQKRPIINFGT